MKKHGVLEAKNSFGNFVTLCALTVIDVLFDLHSWSDVSNNLTMKFLAEIKLYEPY